MTRFKVNSPTKICIIPARGGSKRIKNKNIKLFYDKPMIAYAIELAQKIFSQIYVSSDSDEILKIAKEYGAKCISRPKELADDNATTLDAIAHASLNFEPNAIICALYPTVPLLSHSSLSFALERFESRESLDDSNFRYIFGAGKFTASPYRAMKLENGRARFIFPEFELAKSNDLEELFFDAGCFYIGRAISFQIGVQILSNAEPFFLPENEICDINTQNDWDYAIKLYSIKNSKNA